MPFGAVDEALAAQEGEGDGSLAYWRDDRASYFGVVCARSGGTLKKSTPVLCQRFRLVWPHSNLAAAGDVILRLRRAATAPVAHTHC